MQDGRQYVPIALIVIVNSSHVARGSQEFIPRRNHADGKHRSARTNSAKRPPVIHGLISSSQVVKGERRREVQLGIDVHRDPYYGIYPPSSVSVHPRCSSSTGNRLINTLSKSFGKKVEV